MPITNAPQFDQPVIERFAEIDWSNRSLRKNPQQVSDLIRQMIPFVLRTSGVYRRRDIRALHDEQLQFVTEAIQTVKPAARVHAANLPCYLQRTEVDKNSTRPELVTRFVDPAFLVITADGPRHSWAKIGLKDYYIEDEAAQRLMQSNDSFQIVDRSTLATLKAETAIEPEQLRYRWGAQTDLRVGDTAVYVSGFCVSESSLFTHEMTPGFIHGSDESGFPLRYSAIA